MGIRPKAFRSRVIGTKPGEKMYEELMSLEETRRAWELGRYFVVLPAFTSLYRDATYTYAAILSKTVTNPYHSGNETPLSKFELLDVSQREQPHGSRHVPQGPSGRTLLAKWRLHRAASHVKNVGLAVALSLPAVAENSTGYS